jgi:undecaprenyl-diphosphatase
MDHLHAPQRSRWREAVFSEVGSSTVLTNHRRAFWWSLALLVACVLSLLAVGRHPASGPDTTVAVVGRFDASVHSWMDDIRNTPTTWLAKGLNFVGSGLVTIPLRAIASLILLIRRRWRQLTAFVLTWVAAEVLLTLAKASFQRERPPGSLVITKGYSFPSGHAVAAAATAVALVLAFLPPGRKRRRWELIAVVFAFVMAFSRVYLSAHWFSDVVAGVLLGTGVAIGSAALSMEIWNKVTGRHGTAVAAID